MTKIAKWHGMIFDRLNPLEEAEACARLAAKGIGQALSAFEDRTYVKVSRRRSPGRGGWSQNRYYRKIHGAVKGLSREVEKQLREAGAGLHQPGGGGHWRLHEGRVRGGRSQGEGSPQSRLLLRCPI